MNPEYTRADLLYMHANRDHMTWAEIAAEVGNGHTPEGCRKAYGRHLSDALDAEGDEQPADAVTVTLDGKPVMLRFVKPEFDTLAPSFGPIITHDVKLERQRVESLEDRIERCVAGGISSITDLADALDRGPASIRRAAEGMPHIAIREDGAVKYAPPVPLPLSRMADGEWVRFGLISDTHLGSKYERHDINTYAYDVFLAEGFETVLHAGNYIEGEADHNRYELSCLAGFDAHIGHFLANYPQRDGVDTWFIDGDDHEAWYAKQCALPVGRTVEQRARAEGRDDLHYLGFKEATIPMGPPEQTVNVRIDHPGGGVTKQVSGRIQNLIDNMIDEAEDLPALYIAGHYHKTGVFFHRGVYCMYAGATQELTTFGRKAPTYSQLGFWTVEMLVAEGEIRRFKPEWHPFKARGRQWGYER